MSDVTISEYASKVTGGTRNGPAEAEPPEVVTDAGGSRQDFSPHITGVGWRFCCDNCCHDPRCWARVPR